MYCCIVVLLYCYSVIQLFNCKLSNYMLFIVIQTAWLCTVNNMTKVKHHHFGHCALVVQCVIVLIETSSGRTKKEIFRVYGKNVTLA